MTERTFSYVPVLKWRQGEYQALMRLGPSIKDAILPLIVVPPVEYDFEEQRPKKTIQEHIEPFAKRYCDKWERRYSFIDLHESLEGAFMDDGTPVVEHIFSSLRSSRSNAVPVVKISHDVKHLNAIKTVVSVDKKGAAIRIGFNDLMSPDIDMSVQHIITYLNLNYRSVDLVIDLGDPKSFEPHKDFAKALSTGMKGISRIMDFRSLAIVGTSLNLAEVREPGGEPTRHEWLLYQQLLKELAGCRQPVFGDYAIETPRFIPSKDMRLLDPAGKIIYTARNTWLIVKGKSFRKNRNQMATLCKTIIESRHYCGRDYSAGDKRIYDTVHDDAGAGNLGTWKEAGVSHHITLVVNQLSKFRGS